MGKLVESTFVTLDGVIGEPQEWGMPYWDEQHNGYNASLLEPAEALLLGRETYEAFAEAWSSRSGDPFTDKMNSMSKHVASRTLTDATWNATVIDGDIGDAVRKVKADTEGTVLKYGTGELDTLLLEQGLLDELHLWVFPVIAGSGDRLLDGAVGIHHLDLIGTTALDSGIVIHKYAPKHADSSPAS